jgi:methyl-accepting chemotaxis protein
VFWVLLPVDHRAGTFFRQADAAYDQALAQAAGIALAEITEAIVQINERNVLIATAAEEQSQVARQVDESLLSIRDLSTQSAAGSHQTSVASGEMAKLAVDLSYLVKQFKM